MQITISLARDSRKKSVISEVRLSADEEYSDTINHIYLTLIKLLKVWKKVGGIEVDHHIYETGDRI